LKVTHRIRCHKYIPASPRLTAPGIEHRAMKNSLNRNQRLRRRRFNALLEKLEDRCLLATITAVDDVDLEALENVSAAYSAPGIFQNDVGPSPIMHWKFEAVPNVADSSLNNINGTAAGDTTTTAGQIGNALLFDGNNDYVTFGDVAALDAPSELTVALWFRRDVDEASGTNHNVNNILIAQSWNTTNDNIEIGTDGGNIEIYLDTTGGTDDYSFNAGIVDGTWYHLAFTYSASVDEMFVYLDGVEVFATNDNTGSLASSTTSPFSIGMSRPGSNNWGDFNGAIDDVQIYDLALNGGQVSGLFNNPGSTSSSGIIPTDLTVQAGAILDFDAGTDTDGNSRWENNGTGTFDFELHNTVVRNTGVSSFPGITAAYEFDGGQSPAAGANGAQLSTAGTATRRSAQHLPGDASNESATLEFWFKPDDLTTSGNGEVIFEDGGGTGLGLIMDNNELVARKVPSAAEIRYDITSIANEFIQAVVTYDTSTNPDVLELFINGISVGTANSNNGNDWSGGDAAAIGTRGAANMGGFGGGSQNINSFNGQVAIFRLYQNQIVSASQVLTNFHAVAAGVTEVNGSGSFTGTTTGGGAVTVSPAGGFTYDGNGVPDALSIGEVGSDSFDYTASDGNGNTSTATVTISVSGQNDAPVATDDAYNTDEDVQLVTTTGSLTANDTDIDVDDTAAAPVAGFTLNYEAGAAQGAPATSVWEELTATTHSGTAGGGDNNFDVPVTNANITLENVTSNYPGITSAYHFNAAGTTESTLSKIAGDPSNNDATFEVWFRPTGNLTDRDIIFESGGNGDGMILAVDGSGGNGSVVELTAKDGGVIATASYNLNGLGVAADDFIHAIGVIDLGNDEVRLYINGQLVDTAAAGGNLADWAGGNDSGIGIAGGNTAADPTTPFEGDISIIRFYESTLSAADAQQNFESIAHQFDIRAAQGGSLTNGVATVTTDQGGSVTVNADGSFTYDPPLDYNGTDTFTYTTTDQVGTLASGQLVYLTMDSINGSTVTDFSGNGIDGTVSGDVTTTPGQLGNALLFDGDSDFIDFGDVDQVDSPSEFTFATWFRRDVDHGGTAADTNHNVNNVLFAQSSATANDNFELGTEGNNVEIYLDYAGGGDVTTNFAAPGGIANGSWHHVAVTYDSAAATPLQVYFDGSVIFTNGNTNGLVTSNGSPLTLAIARPVDEAWGDFEGALDDVGIWTRGLSNDEVSSLYADGNGAVPLTLSTATATINIAAVNDAPTITLTGNPAVAEDSGVHNLPVFASLTPGGGADEAGQVALGYTLLSVDNPDLFSAGPTINAAGDFDFTVATDVYGIANVTVIGQDDGGTANGGQDMSAPATFAIQVTPVNDAPTATDDSAATDEDTTVDISSDDLVANDTDTDNVPSATIGGKSVFYDGDAANDGSLQTWESTASPLNITLPAAVTLDLAVASLPGLSDAYSFDGTARGTAGSLESLPTNPSNNSASLEIWFRPDADADRDVLFESGGSGDGVAIEYDGATNTVLFTIDDGAEQVTVSGGASVISNTEFNHVVATYDRDATSAGANVVDVLSLYINGTLVDTDGANSDIQDFAGGNGSGIGGVNDSAPDGVTGGNFEGHIAKLGFYERTLNVHEVLSNYNLVSGSAKLAIASTDALSALGSTITTAAAQAIGEIGTISTDHNAVTITLVNDYTNPIVIAQPLSIDGTDPSVARITDVNAGGAIDSFTIFVDEQPQSDGTHAIENWYYVVVEAGEWNLEDGTVIQAGSLNTSNTRDRDTPEDPFVNVTFTNAFDATPAVISQVQSDNGPAFVKTRQQNSSETGFDVVLEEAEFDDGSHSVETIGWIALESGTGRMHSAGISFDAGITTDTIAEGFIPIAFATDLGATPALIAGIATYEGLDPAELRFQNLTGTGVELLSEEDRGTPGGNGGDTEFAHATEQANYWAFSGTGSFLGTSSGTNVGDLTYDPTTSAYLQTLTTGETATDTLDYTLIDAGGGTDTGTVSVDVSGDSVVPFSLIEIDMNLNFPVASFATNPGSDSTADTITLGLDGAGDLTIDVNGVILRTVPAAFAADDRIEFVGSTDDDALIIDYTNGNPIPAGGISFVGGGEVGGDSILVRNGNVDQVTHTFTSADGGSIVVDPTGLAGFAGDTITYTGLELSVDDQLTAIDKVVTTSLAAQTITLSNSVPAGQTQVAVTTGVGVTLNNSTGSLSLNSQTGADTIEVQGVDAAFDADLNVNGDATDTISFNTNGTDIGSGDLSATGQSITVVEAAATTGAATLNATTAVTIAATGSVSAGGAVDVDAGTSVVVAGSITGGADIDIAANANVDLQDNSSTIATGSLTITADADNNGFAIINLAGEMNGTSVTVNSGDFSDLITLGDVNGTVENVLANLTINAGAGSDSLVIDDSGDATDDASIVLTNSLITGLVDNGSSITINGITSLTATLGAGNDTVTLDAVSGGTITNVLLNGGTGDDQFHATPNSLTTITIHGNDPVLPATPGDILHLDLTAVSLPIVFPATTDGAFVSTGNQNVTWTSMENFTINDEPFNVGDVFIETTPDRDRVILSAAGRGESQARINNVFYGPFPVTGKYVVYGRESGDRLTASGNLNVPVEFHGGDGRDYLAGGRFDDTMFGDNGNDTILTGDGDNTAFGGNGNDNITARGGSDLLVGDGGNDRLQGGSGSDIIYGDDLLHAEVGTDQLVGGNGPDLLVGGFGNDILSGGAGNDVLLGGAGEDLIRADRGNDLIVGGSSGDSLFGGGGSDKLVSGTAANEADTLAVLQQVLLDWANTADYSGLGGFTGDGASDVDGLNGNGGADEYFIGPEDVFLLSGGDLPLVSI
jgi:hypothetical protein